jgi:hypothetical protein
MEKSLAKEMMTSISELDQAINRLECQIASNRDPFFACNVDPLGVRALVLFVSGGGLST